MSINIQNIDPTGVDLYASIDFTGVMCFNEAEEGIGVFFDI
jgi:hypothetical protein